MINDPFSTLGVVPIFVNAGAALVPTIVAAVSSAAAVLLKPAELVALIRRKPWLPFAVIAGCAGVWFLFAHLLASPAQASTKHAPEHAAAVPVALKVNWTEEAMKILDDERNALKTSGVKATWSFSPEDGAMVLSAPAYAPAANRVIATAAVQDVATFFGVIYCVEADTGKTVWKTDKVDNEDLKPFFSSPALTADQKSIVIGQGLHADDNCNLLCFDADSGRLKWKVPTPLHIESSPAIHGDLAVVGAGAIEDANHKPKTDPGYVFAVKISTGKQIWKHPVFDPESSPAIAEDGTVYIGSGFNGNAVVALRSDTDEDLAAKKLAREIWKIPAPYPITGPVTLDGDLVIVGGGNSDFVFADPNPAGVVMALNRKDGSVRWQTPMEDSVLSRIVVRNGLVYCPVRSGDVVALSLADGKQVWRQAVSGKSPVLGGVAVSQDNQTVFAVSKDGTLALIDAKTGKFIEKHPLNAPGRPGEKGLSLSTPTLANNNLYVGSETGGLRAFQSITTPPK